MIKRNMVACTPVFSLRITGTCGYGIRNNCLIWTVSTLLLLGIPYGYGQKGQSQILYLETTDLNLLLDETHVLQLIQIGSYNTTLDMEAYVQHPDIVQLVPSSIQIPCSDIPNMTVNSKYDLFAYGKSPGHSEVTFNVTPAGYVNIDTLFLRINVMRSQVIDVFSYVMGWIYFVAWSVSFYPQIYTNFQRKSVVGLNFDFLALNFMGNTMYSFFNCGLYYANEIQTQYFTRYPRGQNPVILNDVFFTLHATFASIITIAQCFIYEREHQSVSKTGYGILGVLTAIVIVSASLVGLGYLEWLDFLYYCSYVKLCITWFQYVPQAYMNYKRKSTVGWSIGGVFLDFLGGILSIMQMTLNAFNYNDWISFLGSPTKFGLGVLTLIFDIIFILQHYVFYRYSEEKKSNLNGQ